MLTTAAQSSGVMAWVAPAGRQTLTLYIAHIVIGMGTLEALGLIQDQTVGASVTASLAFCIAAVLYARLWAVKFRRGPIEALMRYLTG